MAWQMTGRMVSGLATMAGLTMGLGMLAGCGNHAQPAAPHSDKPALSVSTRTTPEPVLAGPQRHVLALGDSLFAGYGLRPEQAYPQQLEHALRARGINVRVSNAGVSGDTTADGLARLDFTLASQPQPPDLVLVCLGGNDMLRGLPPTQTRANLAAILEQLRQRHIPVVMMGMLAAPNLGKTYEGDFNAIYPGLARQYRAELVPFFLSAVIDRADLRLADHVHPTAAGVQALVNATQAQVLAGFAS